MPDSQDPQQVNNNDLRNAQFGGGLINAENVNASRIGGDIWNIFFGQQTTPVGNPARPKNERILLAAVKEEVTARLRQSLHNAVLINLGKESQPQQVKRPWDAEIKIGLKPAVPLPDTTTILEIFDSPEISGKLLILGAPGSGKTTTQLELAQALVSRAEEQPDYPVSVLFNLSSWKDDRQSMSDWLVAELKSKYGVSKKLGKEWVENHQLLPLLDGLDELEPQRQELCVHAINQFLAGETRPLYLVVCSRIEEYKNYSTQLQLNGAIHLQPLSSNQIYNYLTSINFLELWSKISNDLELLELAKIPLLLSITVLTFQGVSDKEWQLLDSTSDRIQYLLDVYVRLMLTRDINSRAYLKNKIPNAKKTKIWLVWFAKKMQRKSQTEFLIEKMQPSCLNKSQKRIYQLIFSWSVGIVFGLAGLLLGLTNGLIFGLIRSGLLLITGLHIGKSLTKIQLHEKIIFNFHQEKLIYILIYGLIFGVIGGLCAGLRGGIIGWLFGGAFVALIGGLIQGQPNLILETNKRANQGIWKSASNAIFFGLLFGLLAALFANLIFGLTGGLFAGLIFGLIVGLIFGGLTSIQHFILRLILYFSGYTPWNYARFLDYCTERMLLQRVGGRYRFIHKLLQDHFAQMEFKRD
nr:NACHT domain-containing protein [Dendronalium sp. ChiSLP03b]MDZ8208991.1 NACHT domain-containing protein [Dendronalium sp. ChiSLP03b]